MCLILVVPSELVLISAREAQPCRTSGDLNHGGLNGCVDNSRRRRDGNLLLQRQLVEHVGQRLGMHQAMFDCYVEQQVGRKLLRGMRGGSCLLKRIIETLADSARVVAHLVQ